MITVMMLGHRSTPKLAATTMMTLMHRINTKLTEWPQILWAYDITPCCKIHPYRDSQRFVSLMNNSMILGTGSFHRFLIKWKGHLSCSVKKKKLLYLLLRQLVKTQNLSRVTPFPTQTYCSEESLAFFFFFKWRKSTRINITWSNLIPLLAFYNLIYVLGFLSLLLWFSQNFLL